MNSKMRSCVMGLILGQFSSPLPEVQKEPVAYLYNGVRLPKLPEWDREKHPFAYVTFSKTLEDLGFDAYHLHVSDTIEYGVNESGNRGIKGWSIASVNRHTDTNWNVMDISDASPSYPYYQNSMWANFDVLNEDGSLYLAASEPIPVYE